MTANLCSLLKILHRNEASNKRIGNEHRIGASIFFHRNEASNFLHKNEVSNKRIGNERRNEASSVLHKNEISNILHRNEANEASNALQTRE